jgi:3-dehydroquinate dehydratase/shikimate dehydrogenase
MTQICVCLTDETTADIVRRMSELSGIADIFEVRADYVFDLDLLTILRSKKRPLMLTCRSLSEGGRWDESDPRRRMVLLEGVKRGYDYVDVEYRSGYMDVMVEKAGRGLVVSYHDTQGTPPDLDALYGQMCATGADVVKIATTPQSVAEVGQLLGFAARTAGKGGTPLVAVAMGPMGVITRVIGGRYGAPFTFASPAHGAESGPGQIPAPLLADLYRVREVSQKTKVFGVLGSHVERSLSPMIHNRAFEAASIDAVYVPLQAEALEPFMQALPELGLSGFSVTRPYKVEILPLLQEVDESAALCGSVNTVVVREDGSLQGSTTDGIGVLAPLKKKIDVKGKDVVIVGAGGAARAAALALQRKGARPTLLARDPAKAEFVAQSLGCASGDLAEIRNFSWDVLINATPVGSTAHGADASPVPKDAHRPGTVVFDMVYEPLETQLLRDAQAAGCAVVEGLEMLIAQAVAQYETWTGKEAPVSAMKSVALYLAQEHEEAGV